MMVILSPDRVLKVRRPGLGIESSDSVTPGRTWNLSRALTSVSLRIKAFSLIFSLARYGTQARCGETNTRKVQRVGFKRGSGRDRGRECVPW